MDARMKKEDLLVALQAKRRDAARVDRENTAKFLADNKAEIARRRAWLRAAAKLSDDVLAKLDPGSNYGSGVIDGIAYYKQRDIGDRHCPISQLGRLDRTIANVGRDYRKSYALDTELAGLLNLGDGIKNTICG